MLHLFVIFNHDRRREHHELIVFLLYTFISEDLIAIVRHEQLGRLAERLHKPVPSRLAALDLLEHPIFDPDLLLLSLVDHAAPHENQHCQQRHKKSNFIVFVQFHFVLLLNRQTFLTCSPANETSYPGTLEPEKVLYWRVDEFDGAETQKGDIWAFSTPGAVGNPQPANDAVDAQIMAMLTWTPADNAASSELYFGTDADAVKNATAASPEYIGNKALGSESYDPGKLALATTYHWRVDAVYPNETVKGLVWSFETADFLLVDDFESYNDIDPPDPNSNRIFDKWIDGFGTMTNGAIVGNAFPPYTEQTIVHGGAQSMPYSYNNSNKTSEATLTLVYPRDWTEVESTKLSLWFRGDSGNAADRMFVALGNSVVYHDDAGATQIGGWTEWVIDLTAFAGVDLTNVNKITIGFGTKNIPAAGGSGTMYFDDIRLIR